MRSPPLLRGHSEWPHALRTSLNNTEYFYVMHCCELKVKSQGMDQCMPRALTPSGLPFWPPASIRDGSIKDLPIEAGISQGPIGYMIVAAERMLR